MLKGGQMVQRSDTLCLAPWLLSMAPGEGPGSSTIAGATEKKRMALNTHTQVRVAQRELSTWGPFLTRGWNNKH